MTPAESKRLLSMFSLAKRAGKLVLGFEAVQEAICSGEASLVFAAKDLSPKSCKEMEWFCQQREKKLFHIPLSMAEIEGEVGRKSGFLAVKDEGFETKIRSLCMEGEQKA